MSEQYTITVPILGPDGEWIYPRVGEMSARHQKKTGEVVYDIALDFPVGATELVAFAQGAVPAKADAHAKADDPAKVGAQMGHAAFPLPGRQRPSGRVK